ncbi:5039_t:CDS:2 [Funneliformis geosporum]|uniref:5039_t:CDS:1 n=1 Tax=Funneliformis geosporum TaxID=1117311 RepID=A0A9W4WU47_9GLOM|nr:5039_t:CDS:2 [Funneliformis geosporum]
MEAKWDITFSLNTAFEPLMQKKKFDIQVLSTGREPFTENLIISKHHDLPQVTFASLLFVLLPKKNDDDIDDNVIYKWPYLVKRTLEDFTKAVE